MNGKGTYNRRTITINQVHTNIEQELIQVTEDKLKLILNEHIDSVEKKNSWIAPLSLFITLLIVFATTDFKEAYLSANTWEAIFIITAVLIFTWLLKSIYNFINAKTVIDIINRIKNNNS